MLTKDEQELLMYLRFIATKFERVDSDWTYTEELGGLKHTRYKSDYTGHNHWSRRLRRAFDWRRMRGLETEPLWNLKEQVIRIFWTMYVALEKEHHLPDGRLPVGVLVNWQEDGHYIAMMNPSVGELVMDFVESEPDNEHARKIMDEWNRLAELNALRIEN